MGDGYKRNLIKNCCAQDGFDGWEILDNGGDGFKVEDKAEGCNCISESTDTDGLTGCWATSYGTCAKRQVVDLLEEGCSEHVLDEVSPDIVVSDWYSARTDQGCHYEITVRLLDADKEEVDKWEFADDKDAGDEWFQARHTFKLDGKSVRYVEFTHSGRDASNWAGHFGAKMAMSSVQVDYKKPRGKRNARGRRLNLLKNNDAQNELEHWEVVEEGGDGWCCEDEPNGAKSIKGFGHQKHDKKCWATSHGKCEKRQLIDLKDVGIEEEDLDKHKPRIVAREWYAARTDCGCSYFLNVRLLDGDKEELDKFEFTDSKPAGGEGDWFKVRHVFKNYPNGVRFIEYTHGGQDESCWAGHYGVKITASMLKCGKKQKRKKRSAEESEYSSSSSSSSSSSDED